MQKVFYEGKNYYLITCVANLLEYKNVRNMLKHVEGFYLKLDCNICKKWNIPTRGNHGNTLLLPESLEFLLVNSKSPHIKRLQKYCDKEVLCLTSREEFVALKTIEQVLKIDLKYQYPVGKFFIDGYDPVNNVAYEIDEVSHSNKKEVDRDREVLIKNILGCSFVRIKV